MEFKSYFINHYSEREMKKFLLPLLSGLILLIIAGVFNKYVLSDKTDLRYTLSERIPTRLLQKNVQESIQQIEIKNNGDINVENIVIKIKSKVSDFEVIKHSKSDMLKTFHNPNDLEIDYPSLPPSCIFKVILKSPDPGIKREMLSITHSKGEAKEALTKESSNFFGIFLYILVCIYLILIANSLKNEFVNRLERDAKDYFPYDDILKRSKPIYISHNKWEKIRKDALENYINKSELKTEVERSHPYKILDSQELLHFSDEEKKELTEKLSDNLKKIINEEIKSYDFLENPDRLLELKKPNLFPETVWSDVKKEIYEEYIANIKRNLYQYPFLNEKLLSLKKPNIIPEPLWIDLKEEIYKAYTANIKKELYERFISVEILEKKIQKDKPTNLPDEYWEEYLKDAREMYFIELCKELILNKGLRFRNDLNGYISDLNEFLRNHNLKILEVRQREEIERIIYKMRINKLINSLSDIDNATDIISSNMPEWIEEHDYNIIIGIAKNISESNISNQENTEIKIYLNDILCGEKLGDNKSDNITDEEWEKIKNLESDILIQKENIEEDKEFVLPLKDKIEKQLEILNKVFDDPSYIDRIEDYSNPFSKGNFERLKMVAEIIKKGKCDK